MQESQKLQEYHNLVTTKYRVYNSLFMNLPYEKVMNIGMLIPLLHQSCKDGLEQGKDPKEIIDTFFDQHTKIDSEDDKIDFFFRVIQYVERQVVLFDSVEDARLTKLSKKKSQLPLLKFFNKLSSADSQSAREKLENFGVRIVFTAHPTQFYPLHVLNIINKLRVELSDNDINKIDVSLQQLGMSSFLNDDKPTPLQEAKNIIFYLRNVYYDAISSIYKNAKKAIGGEKSFENYDLIQLGFWPGGDRDGNPFVTAETTMAVADELRMTLYKCYYRDVKILENLLTFRKVIEPISSLKQEIYSAIFDPSVHIDTSQVIKTLEKVRHDIISHYNGLYLQELEEFIDKIKIFRSHFATLDIRQDSSIHRRCISAIAHKHGLTDKAYEDLSPAELHEILSSDIQINSADYDDPLVKDTIDNIKNLKSIQAKNGERGCDRYIISNSEDEFAVLSVHALFRWCGYEAEDITFDIVPLFETMDGMESSEATMHTLFKHKNYKKHIQYRHNRQDIMLGFSDGTKDGGYLQANWNIHKTKERLSIVCQEYGIKPVFFDGRGGPPARGGGKTHSFYAAQGNKIANNEIQLTIQGQTITSTYGTEEAFVYNVEQMITAGISHHLQQSKRPDISKDNRALMQELGELSFKKYEALKMHEMFIPYLEEMSTLKYYGNANIGSRPGKRGNSKKLTLKDLRAISFVGSWSQLKQNVPGYFGIGTAIKSIQSSGRLQEVKDLFVEVPFFKALILNSMMSLTKSYFELTSYMSDNEKYREFWNILHDEYQLSKEMLLIISDYSELMEEEQISKTSIGLRERIVLPLLTIQQYALQTISGDDDTHQKEYEKIVTRSLYGNINASRNSA